MEMDPQPTTKKLGPWIEALSWSELFRFAHASQADELVRLYNQEATWLFEGECDPLTTATVQISSWSTSHAGLDGYTDIGINITRVNVRVDIAEAGFRVNTMDAMANAISITTPTQIKRYMEPQDLLRWTLSHLWYVRKWPTPTGFPGVSNGGAGKHRKPWRKWK